MRTFETILRDFNAQSKKVALEQRRLAIIEAELSAAKKEIEHVAR